MDKLLQFLISQIVDQPEAVRIETGTDPTGTVILTASVAPEDMGKIIGKGGKIISAIRELVKVKAIKTNQRVKVVLAEPQTDPLSPLPPSAQSPETS